MVEAAKGYFKAKHEFLLSSIADVSSGDWVGFRPLGHNV